MEDSRLMLLKEPALAEQAPEQPGLPASDKTLAEACRRGDPDAFRALFERYKDAIYSVALRYSGDQASAQDITQETFLKAFTAIHNFRGDAALKSWLYRLAVNCCFDQKRRRRRLTPLLDEVLAYLPSTQSGAFEDVLRAEVSGKVQAAVAGLSDAHRILIVLRYTEGLSYDQIAEVLGYSAGTVASRLSRIHRILERRLARFATQHKGGRS